MANLIQNMAGLGDITEQVVAADIMLAAKSGIKNYAAALSETATPHLRSILKSQLNDAINIHEKITNYMLDKGYYDAYNPTDQIQADVSTAETILNK